MNKIEVNLKGSGKSFRVKTDFDFFYQFHNSRTLFSEYKMLLKVLEPFDGETIFPFTGNAPAVPACVAALNPKSRVTVYERDAHDYRAMKSTLSGFKNIEVKLAADAEKSTSENVRAIVTVLNNSDRLFSFDIIEKLNEILPDKSDVFMLIQRKRQKDFMKKLGKEFFGGNIIDKCREAFLYRCKTRADNNKWTPRETVVKVDAIGAMIDMKTRPGVFAHGRVDTGGLALYESVDLPLEGRVLELGCGAGLAGLLLAKKSQEEEQESKLTFTLVDSDARAIEACRKNIELNELQNVKAELTDIFESDQKFDIVIGNPPYYANHRIAEYFIKTASEYLTEEGELYIVSKHPQQMEELFEEHGLGCSHISRRGYTVSVGDRDI